MRYATLAVLALAMVIALFLWRAGGPRGPRLEEVAARKEPRITECPSRRVLVVERVGDPVDTFKAACGVLFRTYYKLPGIPKGSGGPILLARWPRPFGTPRSQWLGRFALPVPDSVTALPGGSGATLEVWEGGPVAEILHVGSYATEGPTVDRLHRFITQAGYGIAGDHEEEYLRTSGWLRAGDPDTYLTVIRYPVHPN